MSQVGLTHDQYMNLIQDTYEAKSFRGEYDGDNNMIYAGFAIPGSDEDDQVWQIKMLTYDSNNLTEITWPEIDSKANTSFSFSWTDRSSYTYS